MDQQCVYVTAELCWAKNTGQTDRQTDRQKSKGDRRSIF